MTEEEAKTKWCPMMKNHYVIRPDFQDDAIAEQIAGSTKCIGTACMMWRHERTEQVLTGKVLAVEAPPGYFHEQAEQITVAHGYCGLAGK